MRRRMHDLFAVAAVAVLTLGVTFAGMRSPAEQDGLPLWFMPFGILMVLLLPGYAITRALLPEVERSMLLLLSLGISVSVTVLGGLVLNFSPWGLHTGSWAVWEAGLTLSGCLWAGLRRSGRPPIPPKPLPHFGWLRATALFAAIALVIAAVWLARDSALHSGTAFTQLWAIPEIDDGQLTLRIGIRSEEAAEHTYEIYIESHGRLMQDLPGIRLAPNETWETVFPLDEYPTGTVRILLFRSSDDPDQIYRKVQISPATFEALIRDTQSP